MTKIPILVTAFNRPDHVTVAMKTIREYKPEKLYLECDGPRSTKVGEYEAVIKVHPSVTSTIKVNVVAG